MRMRKLITGTNAEGRSCIVEESEVSPARPPGMEGVAVSQLWATDQGPLPPGPPQSGHANPARLEPGALHWMVVEHDPVQPGDAENTSTRMHHNQTLEMVVVLEGSTRLVLDADERELVPGDCVVMHGVDHALVAGPQGSRILALSVGTLPPD